MRYALLKSLLELAHATSQNLSFAHRNDVYVSYGEETITETNLLELRRRHPQMVRLLTFGKKKEALNGADWEWHIIGRKRKLRMRVQAKRLQKDDKLKIPHKIVSSGEQQIDLLIADAKAHRLKPVYCLYASEAQRSIWQKGEEAEFEYGCLLSCAYKVRAKKPKFLPEIEADCIPWHYLVKRQRYLSANKIETINSEGIGISFLGPVRTPQVLRAHDHGVVALNDFPTLDELNAVDGIEKEFEGVAEADSDEYNSAASEAALIERGISRIIEIDVRGIPSRG